MGYTHYFSALRSDKFLAEFAQKAIELTNVKICGGDGTGEPTVTENSIVLNGDATMGLDHETFAVEGDSNFQFCKTARKPYDEVVTAILLAAMKLGCEGAEHIGSDGGITDWIESGGVDLYVQTYQALYMDDPMPLEFAQQVAIRIGGAPENLLLAATRTVKADPIKVLAEELLEAFEGFLIDRNIYLPDSVREMSKKEPVTQPVIYGSDYKDLEVRIEKVLKLSRSVQP